jgi:heme/copper-type cytochrome/quinol oxidase subunit 2
MSDPQPPSAPTTPSITFWGSVRRAWLALVLTVAFAVHSAWPYYERGSRRWPDDGWSQANPNHPLIISAFVLTLVMYLAVFAIVVAVSVRVRRRNAFKEAYGPRTTPF